MAETNAKTDALKIMLGTDPRGIEYIAHNFSENEPKSSAALARSGEPAATEKVALRQRRLSCKSWADAG
jgi:hypothetical protein